MSTKGATKGAMIAALAAGMFMAGTAAVPAFAADAATIHCQGVNSCKGTGACHSASNGCKGQNSCKGKGWIELSEKECKAKGGTVVAPTPWPEKK